MLGHHAPGQAYPGQAGLAALQPQPAIFADWLTAAARSEYVLCEAEPTQTVTGFTLVGGAFPTTYERAFARTHQTTVIPGGLFGLVVGVQINADVLVPRLSPTAVEAAPGSWYWDEGQERLYVRTTSGADPDTFTLVQVAVRVYFANAPITLRRDEPDPGSAVYYLPWLTNDLPRIRRRRDHLLHGSMGVPEGQVTFTNAHKAWFTLVAPDGVWNWRNKLIRFFIGGSYNGLPMTRAQYAPMAAMRVEDVAPTEEVCTLILQPLQRFAEIELPVTPYFAASYPNLGDGVQGTKKWIGYGRTWMRPDLTDTVTSQGVYTIADAAFQTLFAVHAVYAVAKATGVWTLLTLTTHYTVDLTACTVTVVSATYPHTTHTIAVDVTGKPDGAGSYHKTYSAIVQNLLTTFLAVAADGLDAGAFAAAATANPNEMSLWVKSPRTLASILATAEAGFPSLGRSALGTLQQTVSGIWTASIWNATVEVGAPVLARRDFASFAPKPILTTMYPTVRVFYSYDHARDQWSVAEADDPATRFRTGSQDRLDLYTYLRVAADAVYVAGQYRLLAGTIAIEAAFEERGARLATLEAGGKVRVTYDPAPSATGAYVNEPFELLEAEVVMAPKLTVRGVVRNLVSIGGHRDTAHGDSHEDTAFCNTAHTDAAHGDSAHGDVAHSDSHTDTAHSDGHGDSGHSDEAHSDSHGDSHGDTAHGDSHTDVAHSDTAHGDTPGQGHTDTPHEDVAHTNVGHSDAHNDHDDGFHDDQHFDWPHEDVSHTDVTHIDDGGFPHTDTAHSDVAHSDVAHSDSHSDSHTDSHGDVAHADGAHSDSHGDTAHGDVAHVDSHTDAAHADSGHGDVAHCDAAHVDSHGDAVHGDA